MMVSTKGRYALRLMACLAALDDGEYGSVKAVAETERISVKYLENIIALLCREGFVTSRRGRDGGYCLSRPAEEYTILSILKLTEGSISPAGCIDCEGVMCGRDEHCAAYPLWVRMNGILEDYLAGVTLADLVNGNL